jgi:hypothetical protein
MILMPATTKAGGTCFAMPDVCLTPAPPAPPIPVPYPNTAQWASADGAVSKVLIELKETVVEGSKIPNSSGDEAGTNGGVTSGVNMKEVQPKQYSSKVIAEGKKVVHLTAMTAHNGTSANAPAGVHVAPSQQKVMIGL